MKKKTTKSANFNTFGLKLYRKTGFYFIFSPRSGVSFQNVTHEQDVL